MTTTTAMCKALTRVGDQFAVLLDQSDLDRLGISPDAILDVRQDGQSLVLSPRPSVSGQARQAAFEASMRKMLNRYEETFRELAK